MVYRGLRWGLPVGNPGKTPRKTQVCAYHGNRQADTYLVVLEKHAPGIHVPVRTAYQVRSTHCCRQSVRRQGCPDLCLQQLCAMPYARNTPYNSSSATSLRNKDKPQAHNPGCCTTERSSTAPAVRSIPSVVYIPVRIIEIITNIFLLVDKAFVLSAVQTLTFHLLVVDLPFFCDLLVGLSFGFQQRRCHS